MAEVGYVGLGVMGGGVAKRLLDAGHTVTGWNRTKEKAQWLIDKGMKWGDSPRKVAEAADVIFVMVTDSKALDGVANGPDGFEVFDVANIDQKGFSERIVSSPVSPIGPAS